MTDEAIDVRCVTLDGIFPDVIIAETYDRKQSRIFVPELTCHDADENMDSFLCSRCGACFDIDFYGTRHGLRHCPNCGAKVVDE